MKNLDSFTTPTGTHEVFEPENAWPGAGDRVFVSTYQAGPVSVFQYAYDPSMKRGWARTLPEPGAKWTEWVTAGEPPAADCVVDTVEPASMELGSADAELAVIGSGFTDTSVIIFNGGDEPTTFVDETRLTTIVKPSLAGAAVTVPVNVRTYTRVSNSVDFAFTAPAEGESADDETHSSRSRAV